MSMERNSPLSYIYLLKSYIYTCIKANEAKESGSKKKKKAEKENAAKPQKRKVSWWNNPQPRYPGGIYS